jgi:anhydro-N-acetylmuramic acid kinase
MKELYLGLMSGTSLDGVDVALCQIDHNSCELLHYQEFPFDKELKKRVLFCIANRVTLQEIGELDVALAQLFANAINKFLQTYKIDPSQITASGVHGQTLWHQPNAPLPFSMQLGNPSLIATQTAIECVADFRQADIANGGQGAPFAPAFHQFLFQESKQETAILNIGGMANITLLGENLLGWDSGCGNVLLDYWYEKTSHASYDKDGAFAKSGTLNQALLTTLLQDPYFSKEIPKSTGREYFNPQWLHKHLNDFSHLSDADIQRTLLELTALSIAQDLHPYKLKQLLVCGGGAKNSFLIQRLRELTQLKVEQTPNSDALEAMAFAWFAYKRIHKEKIPLASVTGAKQNSLLGGIYG